MRDRKKNDRWLGRQIDRHIGRQVGRQIVLFSIYILSKLGSPCVHSFIS